MELKAISASRSAVVVHANQIMPAIIVSVAPMVSTVQIACHAIVIKQVQLTMSAIVKLVNVFATHNSTDANVIAAKTVILDTRAVNVSAIWSCELT